MSNAKIAINIFVTNKLLCRTSVVGEWHGPVIFIIMDLAKHYDSNDSKYNVTRFHSMSVRIEVAKVCANGHEINR